MALETEWDARFEPNQFPMDSDPNEAASQCCRMLMGFESHQKEFFCLMLAYTVTNGTLDCCFCAVYVRPNKKTSLPGCLFCL